MEAELVAAALALKEAINCAGMLGEPGFEETFKCDPIHNDNSSALHVAWNKSTSSRANHVALRLFDVPDTIQEGTIAIQYVSIEINVADIGTTS